MQNISFTSIVFVRDGLEYSNHQTQSILLLRLTTVREKMVIYRLLSVGRCDSPVWWYCRSWPCLLTIGNDRIFDRIEIASSVKYKTKEGSRTDDNMYASIMCLFHSHQNGISSKIYDTWKATSTSLFVLFCFFSNVWKTRRSYPNEKVPIMTKLSWYKKTKKIGLPSCNNQTFQTTRCP